MKYFSWIAIIFVAAAVIAALFLIGSPASQRILRFDERRLRDLQSIQYQILNYFAINQKLPAALSDLQGFENYTLPKDPKDSSMYEYAIKGPMQFQLCANFATASEDDDNASNTSIAGPYYNEPSSSENWRHSAGRGCFDLKLTQPSPASGGPYPSVTVKPADA